MQQLILIDGNNWGFAGMAAPKLSAGDKDTQSILSCIQRIANVISQYPKALIMVLWDGRSWRKDIYSEYKANRDKSEAQVRIKESYLLQKTEIQKAYRYLGITQVSASNMEADDLAAILTNNAIKKGIEVTLMTADHDWMQLVQPGVKWVDLIHDKICQHETFKQVSGFTSPAQFVEAKCILGDRGDNIKGIDGVGPKMLETIYSQYESFQAFLEDDHPGYTDKWALMNKKVPKIIREMDHYAWWKILKNNYKLVDLNTPDRPKPINLKQTREPLDRDSFKEFCYRNSFTRISMNLDRFLKPFEENCNILK